MTQKYSKGRRLKNILEVANLVQMGAPIYWLPKGERGPGKAISGYWMINWQFRYLLMALKRGDLYIAKRIPE